MSPIGAIGHGISNLSPKATRVDRYIAIGIRLFDLRAWGTQKKVHFLCCVPPNYMQVLGEAVFFAHPAEPTQYLHPAQYLRPAQYLSPSSIPTSTQLNTKPLWSMCAIYLSKQTTILRSWMT